VLDYESWEREKEREREGERGRGRERERERKGGEMWRKRIVKTSLFLFLAPRPRK
jgi:hypothetical protein